MSSLSSIFEAYREVKSKRYNKYRKETIKNIVLDKFLIKNAVDSLKKYEQSHHSEDLFEN